MQCLCFLTQTTMASTDTTTNGTVKPTGGSRLPPLEKLVARMALNNQLKDKENSPVSQRPRLAANALRTGSSISVATSASTTDSVAVNAPSTRSTSPSALSATPPQDPTTPTETGGDPLTSDKLEKHNQETVEKKSVKVGYKNIPSLDAITARLVKARQLSVDGSAKPPDAPMIEDPKTPGVHMTAPEHPLQFPWYVTFFLDTRAVW